MSAPDSIILFDLARGKKGDGFRLTSLLHRYKIPSIKYASSGQGARVKPQFPIGGDNPRARSARRIRCNSGVDGIVRMKEEQGSKVDTPATPAPKTMRFEAFSLRNDYDTQGYDNIPAENRKPALEFLARHNGGLVLVSLLLMLGLWALIIDWGDLPSFLLPAPRAVWQKFLQMLSDGTLLRHAWVTLYEVLLGLLSGSLVATVLGYFLSKSPLLEKVLSPYLVASQAIPTVAIAPLLIIWFGPGVFSKILICALIVFFPVLVNTIIGFRAVSANLYDLMRSMRASRVQTLRLLELPAALPVLFGGLRIGAALSVIGAVVGEFVGSDKGLGFLINVGRGQYDTALVFVAIFTLILMALCLYGLAMFAEKRTTRWKAADRG